MNLAELDPRNQWWTDLCAEVAQAGSDRLASLSTVSPEQDVGSAPAEPDDAAPEPPISPCDTGIDADPHSGADNPA
jgi:hypothetical protein